MDWKYTFDENTSCAYTQPGAPGHGALVGAPEVLHVDTCGDGLKRALDVLIRAAVRARARAAAAGGDGKRSEHE